MQTKRTDVASHPAAGLRPESKSKRCGRGWTRRWRGCSHLGKVGKFLTKVKHKFTIWLSKSMCACSQDKQKAVSTLELAHECSRQSRGGNHSDVRGLRTGGQDEVQPHRGCNSASTWTNLGNMLVRGSQMRETACYTTPATWNVQKRQIYRERDSWLPVAGVQAWGGFWGRWKVLKPNCHVCTNANLLKTTESYP